MRKILIVAGVLLHLATARAEKLGSVEYFQALLKKRSSTISEVQTHLRKNPKDVEAFAKAFVSALQKTKLFAPLNLQKFESFVRENSKANGELFKGWLSYLSSSHFEERVIGYSIFASVPLSKTERENLGFSLLLDSSLYTDLSGHENMLAARALLLIDLYDQKSLEFGVISKWNTRISRTRSLADLRLSLETIISLRSKAELFVGHWLTYLEHNWSKLNATTRGLYCDAIARVGQKGKLPLWSLSLKIPDSSVIDYTLMMVAKDFPNETHTWAPYLEEALKNLTAKDRRTQELAKNLSLMIVSGLKLSHSTTARAKAAKRLKAHLNSAPGSIPKAWIDQLLAPPKKR